MAIISGNKSSLNKKKKDFESKFRMNAPKDQDDALLKIVRVSPQLAKEIGLIPSILLLQFEFWLHVYTHEMDGRRWFYMTTEEMHEELQFVSEPRIRRAVNKLRQLNLIIVGRYNKRKEDRTNWYSINTDAIQELKSISWADDQIDQITDQNDGAIEQIDQNEVIKMIRPSDQNDATIPERIPERIPEIFPPRQKQDEEEKASFRKKKLRNLSLVEFPRSEITVALLDVFGGIGGAGSVAELSALVESGQYSVADIRGCGEWILRNYDRVRLSPETVIQYLPTYIGKRRLDCLTPGQRETPSEKLTREWSDPERDQDLAIDVGFGRHRRAMK
jgi:hypothetical protein